MWFIDGENLRLILILKEKMTRFCHLIFFYFPNFEISSSV